MGRKFRLDGVDYDVDSLSSSGQDTLASLEFVTDRIAILSNMQSVLSRAKNSYLESLKQEIISNKAGFILDSN